MPNTIIKVEKVSKAYQLGQFSTGTLSRDIERWWALYRGKEDPFLKVAEENNRAFRSQSEVTWSLKDVSFDIEKGAAVGIIGRNGAGKSTLLKILSRVTTPTQGKVKINGKLASLLEVGTGFHPELTGRENIFLNGAIMGMRRWEVKEKFDEIVEFAGVAKYIDTPVKRYSSGMYVRLAFAVAAHLEPDILVVDEVLAVGDAEFQKKCLGKMKDVSSESGRTVLFVSHNMAAVKSLCDSALVLERGCVKFSGNTNEAVNYYLKGNSETQNQRIFGSEYDTPIYKLNEIHLKNTGKEPFEALVEDEEIELFTSITIKDDNPQDYHITYHLIDEIGEPLFSISPTFYFSRSLMLKQGINKLTCTFPKFFFQSGTFYLSLFIVKDKKKPIFIEKDIISFTIVNGIRGLGAYMGREPGFIRPIFEWSLFYAE